MGGGTDRRMRQFWDARAREDAYYFVNDGSDGHAANPAAFWATGRRDVDRVVTGLGATIEPTETLVEVGCGVGRMTRPLAARAARVIAVDVSAKMLELARRDNPALANVRWQLGDGSSLSGIADASADCCISFVVFQHIPDAEITLGYVREIGRVLRPGGWAAVQVSDDAARRRERTPTRRIKRRVGALRGRFASKWRHHPAWRGSTVDLERLSAAAGDADLIVERTQGRGTQYCLVLLRRA